MIQIKNLRFAYPGSTQDVLRIDDFHVAPKERVRIQGASGAGKSTLLNLISGILRPNAGTLTVHGEEWTAKSEEEVRELRSARIGFIFQDFGLLEYLNVTDNILLPYRLHANLRLDDSVRTRMGTQMESLGLKGKETAYPDELSFGERQRVAIARAVIAQPAILLADEPTASLDDDNSKKILELLSKPIGEKASTFLMVSHARGLESYFDRVVTLENGTLISA